MKLYKIIIPILIFLVSCARPEPSIVEFDGFKFKLPVKVQEAKSSLGLWYGYYSGFDRSNKNGKSITTQLEGYPLFMGSDNDSEERYYDQFFVGITFFKSDMTLQQVKSELQEQYGKEFKTKMKDFGVDRSIPPYNMTYYYLKADAGFFIALKEIKRPHSNKHISISFYKGISESKLDDVY